VIRVVANQTQLVNYASAKSLTSHDVRLLQIDAVGALWRFFDSSQRPATSGNDRLITSADPNGLGVLLPVGRLRIPNPQMRSSVCASGRSSKTTLKKIHHQKLEENVTKMTRDLSSELSRRDLFKTAAGVAGTVAVLGLSSHEALAAKMSKQSAAYQATPKSGQSCAKCRNFESPSACKSVEGPVSPNGWCNLYTA
jgi:hypothetical protein